MAQFELITGHAKFEFLSLGSSYEWKLRSGTAGAGGLNNKMLQQTKTIDAKNWKTHPKWNWKKGGVDLCIISVNARISYLSFLMLCFFRNGSGDYCEPLSFDLLLLNL